MQRSTEQLTTCSTGTLAEENVQGTSNVTTTKSISEKIMNVCRKSIRWIFLLDILLALSVTTLMGVLEFGTLPHQHLGFFCNDPKISFKFVGDTISIATLISLSLIIPAVVIWIVEYACHPTDGYDTVLGSNSRMRQFWIWYGHYTVGIVTLTFMCNVMKLLVGEPRPHFLDTCKPREAMNCTDQYIVSYTCTNTDNSKWFVADSSKSFPSGHSAISVYTSIFIVWYLQNRLMNQTFLLKPWLQCMACLWGVMCSLTRISDNRHHWWDVLAGNVLGILFSVFIVIVPCRHFHLERVNVTYAFNEPVENGQIGLADKRNQNIRRLLTPVVEITEGREMRDVHTTWKE